MASMGDDGPQARGTFRSVSPPVQAEFRKRGIYRLAEAVERSLAGGGSVRLKVVESWLEVRESSAGHDNGKIWLK